MPTVTVLMPVYNCEVYVGEAVESILNQTFTDFDFLIIDDGSTDTSREIIQGYAQTDSRIRFVENEKNLGLVASLNKGVSMIKTEFIARMDADDISLPKRLETQIKFMKENLDVDVCGTAYVHFGNGHGLVRHAECHDDIKIQMCFDCPIGHPTVVMRTALFEAHSLSYNECLVAASDYELFATMIRFCKFHNLQDCLLKYRIHTSNISVKHKKIQHQTALETQIKLLDCLGIQDTEVTRNQLCCIHEDRYLRGKDELISIEQLFVAILNCNKKIQFFDQEKLEIFLEKKFFFVCFYCSRLGMTSWRFWEKSLLSNCGQISGKLRVELYFRCLLSIKK